MATDRVVLVAIAVAFLGLGALAIGGSMSDGDRVAELEAALRAIQQDAQSASALLIGHAAQPIVDQIAAQADRALASE